MSKWWLNRAYLIRLVWGFVFQFFLQRPCWRKFCINNDSFSSDQIKKWAPLWRKNLILLFETNSFVWSLRVYFFLVFRKILMSEKFFSLKRTCQLLPHYQYIQFFPWNNINIPSTPGFKGQRIPLKNGKILKQLFNADYLCDSNLW